MLRGLWCASCSVQLYHVGHQEAADDSSWHCQCAKSLSCLEASIGQVGATPLCAPLQAQEHAALCEVVWDDEEQGSLASPFGQHLTIVPIQSVWWRHPISPEHWRLSCQMLFHLLLCLSRKLRRRIGFLFLSSPHIPFGAHTCACQCPRWLCGWHAGACGLRNLWCCSASAEALPPESSKTKQQHHIPLRKADASDEDWDRLGSAWHCIAALDKHRRSCTPSPEACPFHTWDNFFHSTQARAHPPGGVWRCPGR